MLREEEKKYIEFLSSQIGKTFGETKSLFNGILIDIIKKMIKGEDEFIIPSLGKFKIEITKENCDNGIKNNISLKVLETSEFLKNDILNVLNKEETRAEKYFKKYIKKAVIDLM